MMYREEYVLVRDSKGPTSHQVISDGRTVWVNSGRTSANIARFSKVGIDIHADPDDLLSTGTHCLDCRKGTGTVADWEAFKTGMLEHYRMSISDDHMPDYLKPRKEVCKACMEH